MAASTGAPPLVRGVDSADSAAGIDGWDSCSEPPAPSSDQEADPSRDIPVRPPAALHSVSDLERLAKQADVKDGQNTVSRSLSVPLSQNTSLPPKRSKRESSKLQRSLSERVVQSKPGNETGPYDFSDSERQRQEEKMALYLRSVVRNSRIENYAINISSADFGSHCPVLFYEDEPSYSEDTEDQMGENVVPPLNICILIVGTRGDVQPFIAIGRRLQEFGHRVRLATHANYRDFVTGEGLEFYPLGGDPKVLAEYMVKNKGFLPSWPSEVQIQRKQLKAIINSTWAACTEPDTEGNGQPFIADAIMANPPTIGHKHVAEALRVPLHVVFTMPWTPTAVWPHPLARISQVAGFENRLSYYVVDNMIWIGVRDIVNDFRKKKLKLPPVSYLGAPTRSKHVVPTAYIWSPSLAPKPEDWGKMIDVVGFCFLNLASNYKPAEDLVEFFRAGQPPIYIGFGSLPVQDPKKMTQVIVKALEHTKQRGIIQKGWGGLGEMDNLPPHVYLLGNCPHDWLFPQCAAVVHHGGAGTTAAGLKAACPTTVVPFFGDQPFWGSCVHEQGVGPEPIPVEHFDFEALVEAINFMLQPQVKEAACRMSEKIIGEDGVEGTVAAFHRHLPKDIRNRSMSTTSHWSNFWHTSRSSLSHIYRTAGSIGSYSYLLVEDLSSYSGKIGSRVYDMVGKKFVLVGNMVYPPCVFQSRGLSRLLGRHDPFD